ncbi:MAG: DUF2085 domain-containing protein [Bryobacterales bacterium]|nr:DUF2085 domain-containing protein [Bryobacterales bacterium]WKZ52581.1 MAG: DUF2085 domain-containing protein [Anaerolineales bacterium]
MSARSTSIPSKPKQSIFQWISAHWFATFLIVYGLWVWTPFLAPVFMRLGWDGAGRAVYFVYSFFCHQLPERSFFFFGAKPMYPLTEIQDVWQNTINPLVLRQFIGNETMGWKVAWSDRMISFYTSVWVFAVMWYPLRRKIKPLVWWGFVLLLLPIAIDGGSHLISDFAGIGNGFRDTNAWLAALTNYALPATFYAGDALGSFNSLMRLVTGLLAGFAIVWLAFPYIFQTQNYNQQLDNIRYAVLETIKSQDSRPAGG